MGFGSTPRPIRPNANVQSAANGQPGQGSGQQRPGRWTPYTTDASGKPIVKPEAKLSIAATAKSSSKQKIPPPAATWTTLPSDSWPAIQKP